MAEPDALSLAFPKAWEPFGWPLYAELQEVRQSWIQRVCLAFGWTIHDVVNRWDVKVILIAGWKAWKEVERTEAARQEQVYRDYMAWLVRMMGDMTPASARVA